VNIELIKKHQTFAGETCFYQHQSQATNSLMKFSLFVPCPLNEAKTKVKHCIVWLSGLTCNEENFITKAGAQRLLSGTDTMIICPDTSPRGLQLPGEHESYDFGTGAGFYVNATTPGYRDHYRMYDYIVKDLPALVRQHFSVESFSLMGHSMGGHGALVIGLREANLFSAVSVFAPLVNPIESVWGKKALIGYLGENFEDWAMYDSCELLKNGYKRNDTIFIDQGLADEFLANQLLLKNFDRIAQEKNQQVVIKYREGYDHSYYYISTFLEEHFDFHQRSRL